MAATQASEKRTALDAQKANLHTIISKDIEGNAATARATHDQSLENTWTHRKQELAKTQELLSAQFNSLTTTHAGHIADTLAHSTGHRATLVNTENTLHTQHAQQQALLAAHAKTLAATEAAQAKAREELVQSVMAGVQELLASKVQSLGATFTASMHELSTNRSELAEVTTSLGANFDQGITSMKSEVASWTKQNEEVGHAMECIVGENSTMQTVVDESAKVVDTDMERLREECGAWGAVDTHVAAQLKNVVSENENIVQMVVDSETASMVKFDGANKEVSEWGASLDRDNMQTKTALGDNTKTAEFTTATGTALHALLSSTVSSIGTLDDSIATRQQDVTQIQAANSELSAGVVAMQTVFAEANTAQRTQVGEIEASLGENVSASVARVQSLIDSAAPTRNATVEKLDAVDSTVTAGNAKLSSDVQQQQAGVDQASSSLQTLWTELSASQHSSYSAMLETTAQAVEQGTKVCDTERDALSASTTQHGTEASACLEATATIATASHAHTASGRGVLEHFCASEVAMHTSVEAPSSVTDLAFSRDLSKTQDEAIMLADIEPEITLALPAKMQDVEALMSAFREANEIVLAPSSPGQEDKPRATEADKENIDMAVERIKSPLKRKAILAQVNENAPAVQTPRAEDSKIASVSKRQKSSEKSSSVEKVKKSKTGIKMPKTSARAAR
jgi:hypothetical protein